MKDNKASLKALRSYERTSDIQEKAAGKCIQSGNLFVSTEKENDSELCASSSSDPMEQSVKKPKFPAPNFSALSCCTFNFYCTASVRVYTT